MTLITLLPSCVEEERPLLDTVPSTARMVAMGSVGKFVEILEPDSLAPFYERNVGAVIDTTMAVAFLSVRGLLITMKLLDADRAEKYARQRYGILSRYEDLTYYDSPGKGSAFFDRSQMWVSLGTSLSPEKMWKIVKEGRKSPLTRNTAFSRVLAENSRPGCINAVAALRWFMPWMAESTYLSACVSSVDHSRLRGEAFATDSAGRRIRFIEGLDTINTRVLSAIPAGSNLIAAIGIDSLRWGRIDSAISPSLDKGSQLILRRVGKIVPLVKGTIAVAADSARLLALTAQCQPDKYNTLARELSPLILSEGLTAAYSRASGCLTLYPGGHPPLGEQSAPDIPSGTKAMISIPSHHSYAFLVGDRIIFNINSKLLNL